MASRTVSQTRFMQKKVVPDTTRSMLAGFVESNIDEGAMIYSDDAAPYA